MMTRNGYSGGIKVHAPSLREELLANVTPERIHSSPGRRRQRTVASPTERRPWTSPSKNRSNTTVVSAGSSRSTLDQTPKIQNWLCHKSVRGIQEKADPESKNTKNMYMAVLDRENSFVRDIENELLHKSFLDKRKKEMLYKKWSEQIFEPIQDKIYRAMKGNYAAVDRKKRELFNDYINHRNKKGYVFLDTFDEKEYDPLSLVAPRPAPITATTGALNDPLIAQRRERNDEDRMVIRCYTGQSLSEKAVEQSRLPPLPLVPLGRHGTECKTWLAMPLHDIESPVRHMSRRRMKGVFNDCHFDFKDWPSFSADSTSASNAITTNINSTSLDAQMDSLTTKDEVVVAPPPMENRSLAFVT
ncbi:protein FAM228B-like [Amphiura filiformis]|uniref:protein FAM228B-like n=1 Tax=Amphiura filiformis TaxID=82378 RepID=UPI003B21D8E8